MSENCLEFCKGLQGGRESVEKYLDVGKYSVGYVRLQILYEVVLKKMDEIRNVLIGLKLVQNSREQFIPDFVLIVILEPDKGAYQNCRVHYEFMLFRLLCTCLF